MDGLSGESVDFGSGELVPLPFGRISVVADHPDRGIGAHVVKLVPPGGVLVVLS